MALWLQLPSLQQRLWIWVLLRVRHLPHQQVRSFPCILQLFQRLHLRFILCTLSNPRALESLFVSPSHRSALKPPSSWLEGCAAVETFSKHMRIGLVKCWNNISPRKSNRQNPREWPTCSRNETTGRPSKADTWYVKSDLIQMHSCLAMLLIPTKYSTSRQSALGPC